MWTSDARSIKSLPVLVSVSAGALGVAALLACGPNLPNSLLMMGDAAVLPMPAADFKREIERVLPPASLGLNSVPPGNSADVFAQSASADYEDLKAALGAGATEEILARYGAVRAASAATAPGHGAPPQLPAG